MTTSNILMIAVFEHEGPLTVVSYSIFHCYNELHNTGYKNSYLLIHDSGADMSEQDNVGSGECPPPTTMWQRRGKKTTERFKWVERPHFMIT